MFSVLTSALKSSIASNIAEATSAVLLLIGTAKVHMHIENENNSISIVVIDS